MKYYIETMEQITTDEYGTLSEYAKVESCSDENTALTKFYNKLSDVSADLTKEGKHHTYMRIKIINSVGNIIKSDFLGAYRMEPGPEPNPTPEEPTEG